MRKENASTLIHLNIFAFLIGSNPWLFLHNQLAYIKLGGGLRYPEKWHQSSEIVTATEKYWNEVVLAGLNKMAENQRHAFCEEEPAEVLTPKNKNTRKMPLLFEECCSKHLFITILNLPKNR